MHDDRGARISALFMCASKSGSMSGRSFSHAAETSTSERRKSSHSCTPTASSGRNCHRHIRSARVEESRQHDCVEARGLRCARTVHSGPRWLIARLFLPGLMRNARQIQAHLQNGSDRGRVESELFGVGRENLGALQSDRQVQLLAKMLDDAIDLFVGHCSFPCLPAACGPWVSELRSRAVIGSDGSPGWGAPS